MPARDFPDGRPLRQAFGSLKGVDSMALKDSHNVVDFHRVDDFRCVRPLRDSLEDGFSKPDPAEVDAKERQLRDELAALFTEVGWEGDGEINCMFVAPCFAGRDDGWCDVVYHVKQGNNGTSWLAIPRDLALSLPEGMLAKRW